MWLTGIWDFVMKGSEEMEDAGTGFSVLKVTVVGQEKRERERE